MDKRMIFIKILRKLSIVADVEKYENFKTL